MIAETRSHGLLTQVLPRNELSINSVGVLYMLFHVSILAEASEANSHSKLLSPCRQKDSGSIQRIAKYIAYSLKRQTLESTPL